MEESTEIERTVKKRPRKTVSAPVAHVQVSPRYIVIGYCRGLLPNFMFEIPSEQMTDSLFDILSNPSKNSKNIAFMQQFIENTEPNHRPVPEGLIAKSTPTEPVYTFYWTTESS